MTFAISLDKRGSCLTYLLYILQIEKNSYKEFSIDSVGQFVKYIRSDTDARVAVFVSFFSPRNLAFHISMWEELVEEIRTIMS